MANTNNLEAIQTRLERERAQLQRIVQRVSGNVQMVEKRSKSSSKLTGSYALRRQQQRKRWQERQKSRLDEVEAALERLEDGTYGGCRVCGELIPSTRLDLVPTARLCIHCKLERK